MQQTPRSRRLTDTSWAKPTRAKVSSTSLSMAPRTMSTSPEDLALTPQPWASRRVYFRASLPAWPAMQATSGRLRPKVPLAAPGRVPIRWNRPLPPIPPKKTSALSRLDKSVHNLRTRLESTSRRTTMRHCPQIQQPQSTAATAVLGACTPFESAYMLRR